jgi:hypothetical protein
VAVQSVLGVSSEKALDLMWMIRNAAFCEFVFSGDRISLSSYNSHPHLGEGTLLSYR